MNTVLKVGAASALTLAGIAAHASIAPPSSGAGDAILFANVTNAAGTQVVASYAGDTGVSVASIAKGLAAGSSVNYLAGDANLQALFKADTGSDVIQWGIVGGSYTGSVTSSSNIGKPGVANIVSTSNVNSTANLSQTNTGALKSFLTGINGDTAIINSNSGNASSIEGPVPATSGVWDYTSPSGISGGYGNFSNANLLGSAETLFDLTGGGQTSVSLATYASEGTATLVAATSTSAGYLTLAGASSGGGGGNPPPVPLPAAVWLLGSGLLGLTGVARRKLKA